MIDKDLFSPKNPSGAVARSRFGKPTWAVSNMGHGVRNQSRNAHCQATRLKTCLVELHFHDGDDSQLPDLFQASLIELSDIGRLYGQGGSSHMNLRFDCPSREGRFLNDGAQGDMGREEFHNAVVLEHTLQGMVIKVLGKCQSIVSKM